MIRDLTEGECYRVRTDRTELEGRFEGWACVDGEPHMQLLGHRVMEIPACDIRCVEPVTVDWDITEDEDDYGEEEDDEFYCEADSGHWRDCSED